MAEICFQKIKGLAVPYTLDDADTWASFKDNQIIKGKVTGTTQEPSLEQLDTFWACCDLVAKNTEDPMWNDKDKVCYQCKVACHFIDQRFIAVRPDGQVNFQYLSIGFSTPEKIRRKFFRDAFPVLAAKLGIDEETMVAEAKNRMLGRRYEVVRKHEQTQNDPR
jgi:hypothetical protein